MISTSDFKNGLAFYYNNEPYIITWFQHHKPGKGVTKMLAKIKNLKNGKNIDVAFNTGERFESVNLERKTMQYLYEDGNFAYFMDPISYEQIDIHLENLGEDIKFLKPEQKVTILLIDNFASNVELPKKVTLQVTECVDSVDKGNTTGNVMKEATLETGLIIKVPGFIKKGEFVNINTETKEYVERSTN
ncbi:elongation factor P [Patescibacteria group bacterium]|nr:elongation factor P [Patescibacteria group bacterium]